MFFIIFYTKMSNPYLIQIVKIRRVSKNITYNVIFNGNKFEFL